MSPAVGGMLRPVPSRRSTVVEPLERDDSVHSRALVRRDDALARTDLEHCRRLLAQGSKSFSAASLLLPRRVRADAAAFYAFCRVADDAVDESADPRRAVDALTHRLEGVYRGVPIDDPVDRALTRLVEAHRLPRAPLDALVDGFAWDAREQRYETLSDVLAYSARVASAVGVVMTILMGHRKRDVLARACDLGAAMQLTNIARDVGEDAGRGRIYLPESWLRDGGIHPSAWLARPRFEPGLAQTVERLLDVADDLYSRARPGIAALPADCRPAIRAAGWIYADIGRVVRKRGYDSVTGRARTSGLRKVVLAVRAILTRRDEVAHARLDAPALPEVEFLLEGAEP